MIAPDLHQPHVWPLLGDGTMNAPAHLVYSACAGAVRLSMVEGRLLMEDDEVLTLDATEVWTVVQRDATDLARAVGLL